MVRLIYKMMWLSAGSRYWTRRKFTLAGQFVMVCMTIAAILGIDTDLTLSYQVFTLSFTLLLLAYLASFRFRGRFEVERHLPLFVTAGEPFSYQASVINKGTKPQQGLDLVACLAYRSLQGEVQSAQLALYSTGDTRHRAETGSAQPCRADAGLDRILRPRPGAAAE